jgi:hypothetical protein
MLMGEVVAIDGGAPEKPNVAVGQALFAAVVDELEAMGVGIIPRSLIAKAVAHGKAALEDGVQPEIVLVGCLTALRQGKPQYAAHIIGDLCFAKAGALMTPSEYRHYLSLESRSNNDAVLSVREAMSGHKRKEIEKGEGS